MSELKPCPFCGESKLLYSGGCGFRYDDDDNQIRLFRVHCRTCKGRTGLFESLDEAVEAWNRRTNSTTIQPPALGTNLAEVSTDCISRQAAIDTEGLDVEIRCEMCKNPMHTDRGCDGHCEYDEKLYERIMQILDERIKPLPSVTPKQRTGKWIKLDMHRGMADHKCTACGQECYVPTCMGEPLYAFCPNCGADMSGEQE